jgi:hypothetical protein
LNQLNLTNLPRRDTVKRKRINLLIHEDEPEERRIIDALETNNSSRHAMQLLAWIVEGMARFKMMPSVESYDRSLIAVREIMGNWRRDSASQTTGLVTGTVAAKDAPVEKIAHPTIPETRDEPDGSVSKETLAEVEPQQQPKPEPEPFPTSESKEKSTPQWNSALKTLLG